MSSNAASMENVHVTLIFTSSILYQKRINGVYPSNMDRTKVTSGVKLAKITA